MRKLSHCPGVWSSVGSQTMDLRRGHGFRDDIPGDLQKLAVNQLGRQGLEVLFGDVPKAQLNPSELVNLIAVLEPVPESGLHGVMEPLTQPISLQVVWWSMQRSNLNWGPRSEETSNGEEIQSL